MEVLQIITALLVNREEIGNTIAELERQVRSASARAAFPLTSFVTSRIAARYV